jgi:predicted HTH transcriptional regulator
MDRPEIEAEGPTTEWKERLPALHKVARTLAAFANGGGGNLWVGVKDDGQICGVRDPKTVESEVAEAANMIEPRPELQTKMHVTDRGHVLEVIVSPGGEGPAAVLESDGSRQIYRREGEHTLPADRDDVKWMQRVTGARVSLSAQDRKVLTALAKIERGNQTELARASFMGERNVKRALVELRYAGLVQEGPDRRFALTPQGHRKLS